MVTGRRRGRDADVVVVGAGFAGPTVAKVLAEAGKRVVVLESGPAWRSEDLVSSHIWARRLHGPYGFRTEGGHSVNVGNNVGWGLGGAGIHHFANWPRMHEEDFELRTRYGRTTDWPIAYDDLRPYYDRVQDEIGLSGDTQAEVWRPPGKPYPLPPLDVQLSSRTLARGFEAIGLRTAPAPVAILSRPYRGRPACEYDGWCKAGCAIGALGNPLVTWIPKARRAGAEFRTGAHVLRVLTENGRATGVEYADTHGRRHVQRGRLVVLATWTLETPRILLNSEEGGLANSSGLVGRSLYQHVLVSVNGLFPQPTDPHRGTAGGQLVCQDTYDHSPEKGYFGGHQWTIGGALKPNDLISIASTRADINGADLEPFMRRAARHIAAMTAHGITQPSPENGLTLIDELDRFGMPKATVTHTFDADAVALAEAASAQGLEILEAAGAEEAWAGGIRTAHPMGATVMGDDPRQSVVTPYGQTHDVENLFIASPGTFPIGGSVNPTFTLNAWTLRSAEFIRHRWRDLT